MTAAILPRPYQRLLAASALTNLSDGIRAVAFPLLAYALDPRPVVIALVAASGLAPAPLFSLIAGGASDRFDRRSLAIRANQIRMVLLGFLSLAILTGLTTIPLVMIAAFVLGTSEVFADNVIGTLVPSYVDPPNFEKANARLVAAEILGNEFAGPALGGFLFAAGMWAPFLSNTALLAAAVLLLAGLPALAGLPPHGASDGDGAAASTEGGALRDGVRFLIHSQKLRTLTIASSILIAIDGAWFSLVVIMSKESLGLGSAGLGVLFSVGAIGGLAGAFMAERSSTLKPALLTTSVFVAMSLPLLALGANISILSTCVALVLTSAAFAVWNVFVVTARQRLTPGSMLGRVSGAYRTIVLAAAVVGTFGGGALASFADLETCLFCCGALAGVACPFVWWHLRDS